MLSCQEIYKSIYVSYKKQYIERGYSEDKASSKANIIAVQKTWISFNILKGMKSG